MNKIKTTRAEISAKNNCYSIGYCEASDLFRTLEPIAYTCGVYGWNADIFDGGGCRAIVRGYRPFGKPIPYKILRKYNRLAERYAEKQRDYYKQQRHAQKLITKMLSEIIHG